MSKIITLSIAALAAITVSAYAMAVQYPCAGEDDRNCFYDARIGGNGIGWSFVDIAGHAVYLWEVKP